LLSVLFAGVVGLVKALLVMFVVEAVIVVHMKDLLQTSVDSLELAVALVTVVGGLVGLVKPFLQVFVFEVAAAFLIVSLFEHFE